MSFREIIAVQQYVLFQRKDYVPENYNVEQNTTEREHFSNNNKNAVTQWSPKIPPTATQKKKKKFRGACIESVVTKICQP